MATFLYTARDRTGIVQTGHVDASNEDEVLSVLQNRGLFVTSVARKDLTAVGGSSAAAKSAHRKLHGRVTTEDKTMFCEQLSTLLEAGVPLLRSLQILCEQVESRPLLIAVQAIKRDIEGGKTFHEAIAKHPKIFTAFWVNVIETGEATGRLSQAMNQLVQYLKTSGDLSRKAVTAFTYPAVLILAAIGALFVFALKIIPIFSGMFASMNVKLPALTQAIISFSEILQRHFLLIMVAGAAAVYAMKQFVQSEQGRWIVDRLLLKLPGFSPLFVQMQLAQFARGLGSLLDSGVPILLGLEIMQKSATNKVYGKAFGEIRDYVREGKPMAQPMQQTGLFPALMVQMIQVGEEIGELGKMLNKVAVYYEIRVNVFIERLTILFEPIAIVFMAVVVGTLVVAMFLPIFSMSQMSTQ